MNKLTTSITKNMKKLGVLTLLSITTLAIQSCSKDPAPAPDYGYLNITNTYPTPATFNIYLDQTRINSGAVSFAGTTGYIPLPVGSHNIKFTTASSSEALIQKDIPVELNSVSSLFLIKDADKMDFLTVKDELGDMSSSKAFVRFINLSPDAPALDLAVKDGDVVISDKAYKASSSFIEVEAKAYLFQIRDKGTGTPLERGDLESIELKAGRSYTVYVAGLITATDVDKPFGVKIITNQ